MFSMATRNTTGLPNRPERGTEFQLYAGRDGNRNIVDFTEHKLLKCAAKATDPQQKFTLATMIDDYRRGIIAVAWRRGNPVFITVTRDT